MQYSPTQGRYKIYLIDEVHMLSGHSFNALLKTLEEPPSYVKFLLATTDPKRLPMTVLSRCLQFNLKRVPIEKITPHLAHICTTEKISFDLPALQLLAKAADGSLRDALSLLDQTIAFCNDHITTKETQQMLGSIEQDAIFRLLDALFAEDGMRLLTEIQQLAEYGPDFGQLLEELLSTLHQISIAQVVTEFNSSDEKIKQLAQQFAAEDIQLYYQIALHGRRDLPFAANPQQGFEMVLLRMLAFKPMANEKKQIETRPIAVATTKVIPSMPAAKETKIMPAVKETKTPSPAAATAPSTNWSEMLPKLELTGMAYALASHCTLTSLTESTVVLELAAKHETLLNKNLLERLQQAFSRYLDKAIKLDIKIATSNLQTPAKAQQDKQSARHATATAAIQNDDHVQKIMDVFGATLDVNSIKVVDSSDET